MTVLISSCSCNENRPNIITQLDWDSKTPFKDNQILGGNFQIKRKCTFEMK